MSPADRAATLAAACALPNDATGHELCALVALACAPFRRAGIHGDVRDYAIMRALARQQSTDEGIHGIADMPGEDSRRGPTAYDRAAAALRALRGPVEQQTALDL